MYVRFPPPNSPINKNSKLKKKISIIANSQEERDFSSLLITNKETNLNRKKEMKESFFHSFLTPNKIPENNSFRLLTSKTKSREIKTSRKTINTKNLNDDLSELIPQIDSNQISKDFYSNKIHHIKNSYQPKLNSFNNKRANTQSKANSHSIYYDNNSTRINSSIKKPNICTNELKDTLTNRMHKNYKSQYFNSELYTKENNKKDLTYLKWLLLELRKSNWEKIPVIEKYRFKSKTILI